MVMGHNFKMPEILPFNDIVIISGPKPFGGKREGWWTISYGGLNYKFFGSVIDLLNAQDVGYDQIKHIKKLAAEAIKLNSADRIQSIDSVEFVL